MGVCFTNFEASSFEHVTPAFGVSPGLRPAPAKAQMGHATAEAVVRAGLHFVPYSFTGSSEAVAVGNVGVSGIPVELVAPAERQSAMERLKAQFPGLIVIDFTLPSAVNGAAAHAPGSAGHDQLHRDCKAPAPHICPQVPTDAT